MDWVSGEQRCTDGPSNSEVGCRSSAEVYSWISRYTILSIRGSGLCFFVGKINKKHIPNRVKSHLIKKNFRFGRPNSPDPGAKNVGPGLKIG